MFLFPRKKDAAKKIKLSDCGTFAEQKKLTGKGLEKERGKGLKRDETKVGTMRALPSPESMAFMMSASGDSTSNSGRRSVTSGPQMDEIAG